MSSLFGIGGGGNVGASGSFYGYSIDQSLRFNDDDSAHLTFTPSSAGNRKTWTWSCWVKRSSIDSTNAYILFDASTSDTAAALIEFGKSTEGDNSLNVVSYQGAHNIRLRTSMRFRDVSSWYHIVVAMDTTQATDSDRVNIYVNGTLQTDFQIETYPAQNHEPYFNSTNQHHISKWWDSRRFFDGYMAEVNFIDGTALDATSFGETSNGIWVPKAYDTADGAYGTNGFYLPFAGDDISEGFNTVTYTGNGGTQGISGLGFDPDLVWIKTRNGTASHALFDSVRGADNVLRSNGTDAENASAISTASFGGLTSFDNDGFTVDDGSDGTFDATNGSGDTYVAWCWDAGDAQNWAADFDGTDDDITGTLSSAIGTGDFTLEYWVRQDTLTDFQSHFSTTRGSTGFNVGTDGSGDMIWYSSGARQLETVGAISTGTWYHWAFVRSSGTLKSYLNGVEQDSVINNTNFSDTTYSIGALDGGSEFSNCRISNLRLTNTAVYTSAFTPPTSNLTAISGTILLTLQDGTFKDNSGSNSTISANNGVFLANNNNNSENTDGSITSTVKANTDYGFSIVGWTGNGTNNATIGHGLSQTPDMVFVKNRSNTFSWLVWHNDLSGATYRIDLQGSSTQYDDGVGALQGVSSSLITLGSGNAVNQSSANMIAYAFHSVSGYSSFGSYTGNGTTSNSITGLGFKPAFLMIKNASASSAWYMFDNTRDADDVADKYLRANLSNAEGTLEFCEFTADGFDITSSAAEWNGSGNTIIYMAFADTRDNAFWKDVSGQGNNWTPNNLDYRDELPDSPTNNFATFNPLDISGTTLTYSEGNLKAERTTTSFAQAYSSFSFDSGKWYAEFLLDTGNTGVGVIAGTTNPAANRYIGQDTYTYGFHYDGRKVNSASYTAYGSAYTRAADGSGDVVGVYIDADNGDIYFSVNGTVQNSGTAAFTGVTGPFRFAIGSESNAFHIANFGQDDSFAGLKTSGSAAASDDNGNGVFYDAIGLSGYLAPCTANLPEPAIGPNSTTTSDEHFNTALYQSNGGLNAITGVGHQPDFLWIKQRDSTNSHAFTDSVRGPTKALSSNLTDSEYTYSNGLQSFDSDGFTLNGNNGWYNSTTVRNYVAWSWKAGGTAVSNTDGSITSSVSANQDAGFSIVSYTGDGTTASGSNVGHGLTQAPDAIIVKDRDAATNWNAWFTGFAGNQVIYPNLTNARNTDPNVWSATVPTASVFYVGNSEVNAARDYIAYCFHSVDGFSKVGTYVGNFNADGPFIYTGFRPAWLMLKRSDSANSWLLRDNKRDPFNVTAQMLLPNSNAAEYTDTTLIDFVSNGFKLRNQNGLMNASGGTFIYIAFAEAPFKYANAR